MITINYEKIGQILKESREKCSFTQKYICDILGVTPQTVSAWENGKNKIDIETLARLCQMYDISFPEVIKSASIPKPVEAEKKKDLTPREQEHIKKYRALDEPGKETVDFILDKELARTKALEAAQKVVQLPEPQKPVEYIKLDIASRGRGIETHLVPKEDMDKAIKLSRKYREENED